MSVYSDISDFIVLYSLFGYTSLAKPLNEIQVFGFSFCKDASLKQINFCMSVSSCHERLLEFVFDLKSLGMLMGIFFGCCVLVSLNAPSIVSSLLRISSYLS